MKERQKDFYERNKGEAVNLFNEKGTTLSGNISDYDRDKGIVTLVDSIQRIYDSGGSKFIEDPNKFEIDTNIITIRSVTTREDRLGRIKSYNKSLELELLEAEQKLDSLKYHKTK